MTVREMLARMDALEFAEWQKYYELEPFGAERDDWHAAGIAHMVYAANAGKDQKLTQEDFLAVPPPKPVQSMADQLLMAKHATNALQVLGN